MSRTLKWILYVLLGIIALAIIVAVIFAIFGGFGYSMMGPYGNWMWDHMRGGYFPWLTVFGGLLCLGFFLLVVVGIVALVTALTRRNEAPSITTVPTTPPPAAVAERPCPNCGRMTQDDWKTCPYCGNPLA